MTLNCAQCARQETFDDGEACKEGGGKAWDAGWRPVGREGKVLCPLCSFPATAQKPPQRKEYKSPALNRAYPNPANFGNVDVLRCQKPGCREDQAYINMSKQQIARQAYTEGWRDSDDGKLSCPAHAQEAQQATP